MTFNRGDSVRGTIIGLDPDLNGFIDVDGTPAWLSKRHVAKLLRANKEESTIVGHSFTFTISGVYTSTEVSRYGRFTVQPDYEALFQEKCSDYPVGTDVTVVVRSAHRNCLFVVLPGGVPGIITREQLKLGVAGLDVQDVYSPGDTIDGRVVKIAADEQLLHLECLHDPHYFPVSGEGFEGRVVRTTAQGYMLCRDHVVATLAADDLVWPQQSKVKAPNYQVGDIVRTTVLDADWRTGRLSVGTKQLTVKPFLQAASAFPTGTRVQGVVDQVVDYGVFVVLPSGFSALMHQSRMGDVAPASFKKGAVLDVLIVDIDMEKERITLQLDNAFRTELSASLA